MSEPFLAEIRIVGFNFAPRGWAFCDGQILPINQNQSLYSLLGTTYGGDGRTSFALPEMRGRTCIHKSSTHTLGQKSGEETHLLSVAEIPAHKHNAQASASEPNRPVPAGSFLAKSSLDAYADNDNVTYLNDASLASTGAALGHENMQPYLALNYCIALQGLFPSRN